MAFTEEQDKKFEEKILQLLDALYGAALRLAKNPDDAEDLVAEAVSKAWANREGLKDQDRFRPWLFRIMTNTFYSDCRKGTNKMKTLTLDENCSEEEGSFSLFEELHEPILFWKRNPEKEFLNKLLREDLQKAVDDLPEDFRMVVVLSQLEGFNYQDMAQILDVPIGTIRSRLSRGRELLQKSLWQHAIEANLVEPQNLKQEKLS
jgi:RNA polymerase sigma-70 factor (ECF subfamily)